MTAPTFVAVDVETANPERASICQVGAVLVQEGQLAGSWGALVDPETWFDDFNVELHGITAEAVRGQPRFPEVLDRLRVFVGDRVVVSHTAFDRAAFERTLERYQLPALAWTWLDTARVARRAWQQFSSGYGLAALAAHCGITFRRHDATEDARAAAEVLLRAMAETGLDLFGWLERVRQPIDPSTGKISREGNPDGPLAGEVIVFTGALSVRREIAAQRAAELGCTVRDGGVTSRTTMLVVGQQDLQKLAGYKKSRKQRTAEQLIAQGAEIQILGEDDFMRL